MSNDFLKFRPLPEDIQTLDESEKACQYCGISYLLLSKYERMCIHVRELEVQLEQLKEFMGSKTQLENEMNLLKKYNKELLERTQNLQTNCSDNEIAVHHLQTTKMSLETLLNEEKLKNTSLCSKFYETLETIASMKKFIIETKHEIRNFRYSVRNLSIPKEELNSTETPNNHPEIQQLEQEVLGLKAENDRLSKAYSNLLKTFESSQAFNETRFNQLKFDHETRESEQKALISELEKKITAASELNTIQSEKVDQLKEVNRNQQVQLEQLKESLLQEKSEKIEQKKSFMSQLFSPISFGDGESKKNEQIKMFSESIARLNEQLAEMQQERQKTIVAHQNRIKQLQDNFKTEIEQKSISESQETTKKISELTLSNTNLTSNLQKKQKEIEFLTNEVAKLKDKSTRNGFFSEKLEMEIQQLKTELQQSAISQKQLEIRNKQLADEKNKLELQVQQAEKNGLRAEADVHKQQIQKLVTQINEQKSQIFFLRDTVKRECEERMDLMSIIQKFKNKS